MNNKFPWLEHMVGREDDLSELESIFNKVRQGDGPYALCLVAESGVGKTRLMRELYLRLLSGQGDSTYWPKTFHGDLVSLDLNPDISNHEFPDWKVSPPFYWWGVRFANPHGRNRTNQQASFQSKWAMPHMALHIAKQESERNNKANLGELIFEILNGSPAVGSVCTALKAAHKFYKNRTTVTRINNAIKDTSKYLEEEHISFSTQFVSVMIEMMSENIPMVLVLDDIHWIDEDSRALVGNLLEISKEKKLPLLILATAWVKEWREKRDFAKEGSDEEIIRSFAEKELKSIELKDKEKFISNGLPGLSADQVREMCQKFGDDLYAFHYCINLLREQEWLFEGGDVNSSLTEAGIHELSEIKSPRIEYVRRRFSEITKDVRSILGVASCHGYRFLDELVIEVARDVFSDDELAMFNSEESLRRAETPELFVMHKNGGGKSVEFFGPAYFEISKKFANSSNLLSDKIHAATIKILLDWLSADHLSRLSKLELEILISVAESVSELSSASNEGLNCQLDALKRLTNYPNKIDTAEIDKCIGLLHFSGKSISWRWRARWINSVTSNYVFLEHLGRTRVETLRTIALLLLDEAASDIQLSSIEDFKIVSDLVSSLTISLTNFNGIRDRSWLNPADEWDVEYAWSKQEEFKRVIIDETCSFVESIAKQIERVDAAHQLARTLLFYQLTRLRPGIDISKINMAKGILSLSATELVREDCLSVLFDGVLVQIIYGWSTSPDEELRKLRQIVLKKLFDVIIVINSDEAEIYQLAVLSITASKIADDAETENRIELFDVAFHAALRLIKKGLDGFSEDRSGNDASDFAMQWLDLGAGLKYVAGCSHAAHVDGCKVSLEKGWGQAIKYLQFIKDELVGHVSPEVITKLNSKIIDAIVRVATMYRDVNKLDELLGNGFIASVPDVQDVILNAWAWQALTIWESDRENTAWIESAYKASMRVSPAVSRILRNEDLSTRIVRSLERSAQVSRCLHFISDAVFDRHSNFASDPSEENRRLFYTAANDALDLIWSCDTTQAKDMESRLIGLM